MAGHKSRWLDKSPPSGRLISAFSQPAALKGILDLPGLAEMIKKTTTTKTKGRFFYHIYLGEPVAENDSSNLEEQPLFIYCLIQRATGEAAVCP